MLRVQEMGEKKRKVSKQRIEVASIPTKNYKEVIEIRVPTRFYWNEDGTFDGIEFGGFKTKLLPWEEDMLHRCLNEIGESLSKLDSGGHGEV